MEKNIKIAGVSIIEILIAMFLVAIALFTIATLFPQMGAHRKGIHESEQAKIIAMEVLEGLQMLSAESDDGCAVGSGDGGFQFAGHPDAADWIEIYNGFTTKFGAGGVNNLGKEIPVGAATYQTEWKTECVPTDAKPFKTATVTVTWTKSGKKHNIDVTGVIR